MRSLSIAKAFTGLVAILILAAGCTQTPTGPVANDDSDGTKRGVYATVGD
jgi:hypothetical protein